MYFSDLTWETYVDYYPDYCSLSSVARREGALLESAAISRAAALVYPSDWAASSARTHYHAAAEKTYKIHFGANLQEVPPREAALRHPIGDVINLLWMGVDWERKGNNCTRLHEEPAKYGRECTADHLWKQFPHNMSRILECK